jgi:hypothetical protein
MSNEALSLPVEPSFDGGIIDSTGLVRITGNLEIKPVSNSVISVRLSKNIVGGVDPIVRGLVISYE